MPALRAEAVEREKRRRQRLNSADSVQVIEAPDPLKWIDDEVTIENPHKTDTNVIIPFKLWPKQIEYLLLLHLQRQTITLKARQLGISWVTIVYCLWLCIFHRNVTVLVFSKDKDAAEEIIRRARGVFKRLRNKVVKEVGRENKGEIAFSNESRFKAFATTQNAGTSYVATFLIVDEMDKMQYGHELYTSIHPTIADGGRIAMIFTAFEEDGAGRAVWKIAEQEDSPIKQFFIPWHARPTRTIEWYEEQARNAISPAYHKQEYPATPEEALNFTNLDARFVSDISIWKNLAIDPKIVSPYAPCVLAIDAGVTSDLFVCVSACWHPFKTIPIVRDVSYWDAKKTEGGQIDFREPQKWIKDYLNTRSVKKVVYDSYQMVDFGQELERIANAEAFSQRTERINADSALKSRIAEGSIGHLDDPMVNLHISNANFKLIPDTKRGRIVKRSDDLKLDLAVGISMANWTLTTEFAFSMDANAPQGSAARIVRETIQKSQPFRGMPDFIYRKAIKRFD